MNKIRRYKTDGDWLQIYANFSKITPSEIRKIKQAAKYIIASKPVIRTAKYNQGKDKYKSSDFFIRESRGFFRKPNHILLVSTAKNGRLLRVGLYLSLKKEKYKKFIEASDIRFKKCQLQK